MMSTIENSKKLDTHKLKENEVLGEQLNTIYVNILRRAQYAHNKFHFTVNEKENENDRYVASIIFYAI